MAQPQGEALPAARVREAEDQCRVRRWYNRHMRELTELLDRQFEYTLEQEDDRVLLGITRLVLFLRADPRLSSIAVDLETDVHAAEAAFRRDDEATLRLFRQLWTSYGPRICDLARKSPSLEAHVRRIESTLGKHSSIVLSESSVLSGDPSRAGELSHYFDACSSSVREISSSLGDADWVTTFLEALSVPSRRIERLVARYRVAVQRLPGLAYRRTCSVADTLLKGGGECDRVTHIVLILAGAMDESQSPFNHEARAKTLCANVP